jgi:hypothetical protein
MFVIVSAASSDFLLLVVSRAGHVHDRSTDCVALGHDKARRRRKEEDGIVEKFNDLFKKKRLLNNL